MNDEDLHPGADPRAELAAVRQRLAAWDRLSEQAARRRFRAESPDRSVRARVDGYGRLVSLEVDPAAVGQPRAGAEVVRAVAAARALAARERTGRVRAVLGGEGRS